MNTTKLSISLYATLLLTPLATLMDSEPTWTTELMVIHKEWIKSLRNGNR